MVVVSKQVLLVEDEVALREVYLDALQEAGLNVDVASEGEEALLKLSQGGYEVVLMDVMIPNKDGMQILEFLQTHPPKKTNKHYLLMTNLSYDSLIDKARSLGAKEVILKTEVTPDDLVNKAKDCMKE